MGLALHVILCRGWLLCGLSPRYFVVGSLLRLDWGMVSRGPFELDIFVYLKFYTNLLLELDYLSILANTFIDKATMKTISKIPTLYCSISKISDPGKRIQSSFVSKVSIVTNFELLNFPY